MHVERGIEEEDTVLLTWWISVRVTSHHHISDMIGLLSTARVWIITFAPHIAHHANLPVARSDLLGDLQTRGKV
jgi:putative hemolysin